MLIREINPKKRNVVVSLFNAYKVKTRFEGWEKEAVKQARASGVEFPAHWHEELCRSFMKAFVQALRLTDNNEIGFNLVVHKKHESVAVDILCRVFCHQPVAIPDDFYIMA